MGDYTITKDPTRDNGPARPDGAVHRLQQGQRRGGSWRRERQPAPVVKADAGPGVKMVLAAQVPGHPGLRPGQPGRPGSRNGTAEPERAGVPRPDAGEQRRRPDRDRDQRRHAGRQRVMLSNNAGDQIVPGGQGRAGEPASRS